MVGRPNTSLELIQKILVYMDRRFIGVAKNYPDVVARVSCRGGASHGSIH